MNKEEVNAAFAMVQEALNKAVMGQLPIGIAAGPLHAEIFRSLMMVSEALKAHFVEGKEEEKEKNGTPTNGQESSPEAQKDSEPDAPSMG